MRSPCIVETGNRRNDFATGYAKSWLSRFGGELLDRSCTAVPSYKYVSLLAVLVAAAALWGINQNILGLFHDDAIYVAVAKSLNEGEGYRIASLPSTPAQTKYPFLYPYALSWLWHFHPTFPENIFVLKSFNAVLLGAIFLLSYFFYCKNTERPGLEAVLYAMLVCSNPAVFSLTDLTLSDLLFMLLTLSALFIGHGSAPSSRLGVAILSVVIGLACLTKPAAAPLAFAGAVFLLRRYRDLILYMVSLLVFTLPWVLWVAQQTTPHPNSLMAYYLSYNFRVSGLDQMFQLVVGNLAYLYTSLDRIFPSAKLPALRLLICLVTGLGLCFSVRRHNSFFWAFIISYMMLVLVWPFHPLRYGLPLIPVLMLFLFRGIEEARRLVGRVQLGSIQIDRLLARAFLLLLVVLNFAWLSSYLFLKSEHHTRAFFGGRFEYAWSGFLETFDWVRRNTDHRDILATGYDPMYYHYTGRKAVRPGLHKPETYFYPYGKAVPDVGTAQEIKGQLESLGVGYLIIDPLDGYAEGAAQMQVFADLLDAYSPRPALVFISSDAKHRVYKLPPPQLVRHDG